MKCPRCQQENPSGSNFCLECATPLKAVSPGGRPAPSYSDITNALSEALEQQTATAEILRVISRSPTTYEPVFEAIVRSASTLCRAPDVIILMLEEGGLRAVASIGPVAAAVRQSQLLDGVALPLTREYVSGRAFIDRRTVHIEDVSAMPDEFPVGTELQRQYGSRGTTLSVPLLRDDTALGVITLVRDAVSPFSEQQITLLGTFARQAVIAIENVRLFSELQASNGELRRALDTQTATREILGIISRSQTDVQPVFDAILASAVRLLRGYSGALTRVVGTQIVLDALTSTDDAGNAALRSIFPQSLQSSGPYAQALCDRASVNVANAETDRRLPEPARAVARARGHSSWAVVPMLRDDEAIGTISVTRREPGGFADDEIELLKTFADQAVIAIENVRLFTELEASNRELTAALDTQTATSDILRVISHSQTDVQPVFDAIVHSAVRLLRARSGTLSRIAGDQIELAAHTSTDDAGDAATRAAFPQPLSFGGVHAQTIRNRAPLNIADAQTDPRLPEATHTYAKVRGYRSQGAVPMLRHDEAVGAIAVTRREPGGFTEDEIALLQTFADQAVIAIENVRLFNELEIANRDLKAASQHKSEFLANMSHELRTPLNAIIGFSEVLSERMFGDLNEKQDEYLKDIHASGQHLLSLINDILDLSKIEAGRMELEQTDFDLPTAIDSALTLVRERAARRSVALHTTVDERLGQVQADERKIRQVLLNLLSNAIKFTPEGGRIDVRAVPVNRFIEVSVTDTGVGIAPEDQEAVFEEFRQVGMADKKVEGTGLGLALSRRFIELHGGRIWVQSQVGEGSTFTFTIPVRRCE
jgi:signal transduction histidine kinase